MLNQYLVLILILIIIGLVGSALTVLFVGFSNISNNNNNISNVSILYVDEVSGTVALNHSLRILKLLRDSGFNVTFIDSSNASVSVLSRELNRGYKLIILVTHGGVARINGNVIVGLFTDEVFSPLKYVDLVEEGYLARGTPYINRSRSVFVFTPKYIYEFVNGIKGSVILAFGCKTLYNPSMAEAFVSRGALAYVGWTDLVGIRENYYGLELFLKYTLKEGLSINDAVSRVNEYLYKEGLSGSSLLYYYPPSAGRIKLVDILLNKK